jgi:putative protease
VLRKPEILAPAGGWPQMRAAVEAGADAVYFGLSALNARARAANFDVEELPTVMAYLHERGVRGFVTMNVLVFDEELAQAEGLVIVGAVQL